MTPELKDKIALMRDYIDHMSKHLPISVAAHKLTMDMANDKMACAQAILSDLLEVELSEAVRRELIRKKARIAVDRKCARDSHGMNPGSAAIETWEEEFDHYTARLAHQTSHHAPASAQRIDARQAVV